MVVQAVLAGAVGLLLVAGLWGLWTGNLVGEADPERFGVEPEGIPTREDLTDPAGVLADDAKRRNLVLVVCEATVVVTAGVLAVYALTRSNSTVPVVYKGLLGASFLVGATLMARALYVRLGLAAT